MAQAGDAGIDHVCCGDQVSFAGAGFDGRVQPSTRWEVVLYVDQGANDAQRAAIADIFLGRAGVTVARLYGPAISEVHAVRPARITLEHAAAASASMSAT